MLLQTVKSRNLWLWGEIVTIIKEPSYKTQLRAILEEYTQLEIALEERLLIENQRDPQSETASLLQSRLSAIRADKSAVIEKLNSASVNTVAQSQIPISEYTNPFKISALQSIDVTWDNPIGESFGISSNFLQSWHNKPVSINFKGISYMGAFGGQTVGNLNINEEKTKIQQVSSMLAGEKVQNALGSITNRLSKIQDGVNRDSATDMEGKFGPVVDTDIAKINDLISNYGEGLFSRTVENKSPYIYLLMENSGSMSEQQEQQGQQDSFVTFVGHIKNFQYSERADKPFLYDYSVQFVGESAISQKVRQMQIEAKNDANSIRLTAVASDTGYSLGYGW